MAEEDAILVAEPKARISTSYPQPNGGQERTRLYALGGGNAASTDLPLRERPQTCDDDRREHDGDAHGKLSYPTRVEKKYDFTPTGDDFFMGLGDFAGGFGGKLFRVSAEETRAGLEKYEEKKKAKMRELEVSEEAPKEHDQGEDDDRWEVTPKGPP